MLSMCLGGFIRRCSDSPPVLLTWKIVTSCSIRIFTASEPSRISLAATREVAAAAVVVSSRRWASMCRPKCLMQAKSLSSDQSSLLTTIVVFVAVPRFPAIYKIIGMAMAHASQMFDQANANGQVSGGDKQSAVNQAAAAATKVGCRFRELKMAQGSAFSCSRCGILSHQQILTRASSPLPFSLSHTPPPFSTPATASHQAPGLRHDRRRRRRSGKLGFDAHVEVRGLRAAA